MSAITPVDDSTNAALSAALRGLAARQRAIARNVANADTPGFVAQKVDFEDRLRAAIAGGDPGAALPVVTPDDAAAGPNGNNVQLDEQMVSLDETGLRYQLLTEAVSARARLLRSAIGRGA